MDHHHVRGDHGHAVAGDLSGYSTLWYETFGQPAEWVTAAQVEFVRRHAGPGWSLLDACCGIGRHSVALAGFGFRVTGVDASPHAIDAARRRVPDATNPQFVCAPVEEYCAAEDRSFDTVICLWQSLGLGTEQQTLAQLAALARVLAPDGSLIIDLYDRGWWESHCGSEIRVVGGLPVRITSELTGNRLHVRNTFVTDDGERTADFDWVAFDSEEFTAIAQYVGLTVVLACASFNDSTRPGTGNSMQFVLAHPVDVSR